LDRINRKAKLKSGILTVLHGVQKAEWEYFKPSLPTASQTGIGDRLTAAANTEEGIVAAKEQWNMLFLLSKAGENLVIIVMRGM
jgi:hypothetical protein